MQKKNNRFKKIFNEIIKKKRKGKKRRRKKKGEKNENSRELQKPNVETKVCNNNKKGDLGAGAGRKTSSKAQLGFIEPIKSTTTTGGERGKK